MSVEELQEIGLGQYRGDPRPMPSSDVTAPARPQAAKQGRIFVNFDGADLSGGGENSQMNSTSIFELAGPFAAYGGGETERGAVMEAVRADWAPYNVIIVDERPTTGDYTMNMTGPTNPFGGGVLGIAPLDCYDLMTHNNITFAFHSANDGFSAAIQATTIGQEVGHSFGLEHVNEPGDIMNPFNAGGDAAFLDTCIDIVQSLACPQQHAAHCPTESQQNAHQELLEMFGSNIPDTAAPAVAITFPADGAVFEPGAAFDITVDATDDVEVAWVQLYNNNTPLGSDASTPYGWPVQDIPEGTYELFVIARDTAENETMSNVVTITVGTAPPAGDESDSGDSNDDDESDDEGDDEGDSDTETAGADGGGGDKGCGCTSSPRALPIWLLLGLVPLVRRRRR